MLLILVDLDIMSVVLNVGKDIGGRFRALGVAHD